MSPPSFPTAKFRLGRIVMTHGVISSLSEEDIFQGIRRHQSGEWGDVCEKDLAANDRALVEGTRLVSKYHTPLGVTFWIITEADRSATTILLPEDY